MSFESQYATSVERDFLLVINGNINPISHCLAIIHPWQTDRQTDRRTTTTMPIARPIL